MLRIVSARGIEYNGKLIRYWNIRSIYYSQQFSSVGSGLVNECHVVSMDNKHIAVFSVGISDLEFWKRLFRNLENYGIPFILDAKYHDVPLDTHYDTNVTRGVYFNRPSVNSEEPTARREEPVKGSFQENEKESQTEKKSFWSELEEDIILGAAASYAFKKMSSSSQEKEEKPNHSPTYSKIQTTYNNNWKKCVTCAYWTGYRKNIAITNSVEVYRGGCGGCNGNPQQSNNNHLTDRNDGCRYWKKWV